MIKTEEIKDIRWRALIERMDNLANCFNGVAGKLSEIQLELEKIEENTRPL